LVYEEYSTSLTYLAKLDRMLEELGYGALKDPGLKARIDANCTDRDSLRAIANDVLKKAQVALSETEERKIPVLTVCGLYVEGLYFLMNVYERLIDNRLLTRSLRKNINQLVLQQKVYTHNMVTLLESVGDDELTGMTGQVKQLEQLFTYMDIRYRHDEKQNRITDVSLKTSYLPQLQDVIAQLRNEIVYEELN
ncbi:MAG: hypothetical protein KJ607_05840, partial [Bacteroidetes bacterium]|nr:hypothetical protein [Bacteroidota bacterium]